jgi:hypothetical protein
MFGGYQNDYYDQRYYNQDPRYNNIEGYNYNNQNNQAGYYSPGYSNNHNQGYYNPYDNYQRNQGNNYQYRKNGDDDCL